MPIYNTRDLIPFVNQLETKIIEMNDSVKEWDTQKNILMSLPKKVTNNSATGTAALVRADEAMAEIGTATFKSKANRGKRLEDTLNELKSEMYEIAATVDGGGGGGTLTGGSFFHELNNAIASVDVTIEDGLKLDYRLRELQDLAKQGETLSDKQLYMPYKYQVIIPRQTFRVPLEEGIVFVGGTATVLNAAGEPFLDGNGHIIEGTINELGEVNLTALPVQGFIIYFPVQMKMKDIPEDFLYLFMNQMIQKNSRIMEVVLTFEGQIGNIVEDIHYMKGVNWTPDFSIMRNHQEIVKEGITPKGLDVEVKDGLAHVTFSYNDHPNLSHFVLERWDESQKKFIPHDGATGIVNK